ncbi:MAG TPA: hypothetical protein VGA84_01460, partial [Thermoanaerobaculia bacterium]
FVAVRQEMTDGFVAVRQEMTDGFVAVRQETADRFDAMGQETAGRFDAMGQETAGGFAAVRQEMTDGFAAMREESAEAHAQTRRHMDVVIERVDGRIDFLSEALQLVNENLQSKILRSLKKLIEQPPRRRAWSSSCMTTSIDGFSRSRASRRNNARC